MNRILIHMSIQVLGIAAVAVAVVDVVVVVVVARRRLWQMLVCGVVHLVLTAIAWQGAYDLFVVGAASTS